MLDFAQLPPEINSTLMYSGPGSGPLLAGVTAAGLSRWARPRCWPPQRSADGALGARLLGRRIRHQHSLLCRDLERVQRLRLAQGLAHIFRCYQAEFDLYPGRAEAECMSRAPGLFGIGEVVGACAPAGSVPAALGDTAGIPQFFNGDVTVQGRLKQAPQFPPGSVGSWHSTRVSRCQNTVKAS